MSGREATLRINTACSGDHYQSAAIVTTQSVGTRNPDMSEGIYS